MPDPRHALGAAAESAVAGWLEGAGWMILARRARSAAGGEVDLVALDPARILVAVEVRARRTVRTGRAAFSVDERRIGRLRRTLVTLAVASAVPHRGLRVDLVTVEPEGSGRWRVTRLPGVG